MTQVFLGIFGFILMLGLLILIHELGHFIAAKLFGVQVDIFSIGFVGTIFSFRIGETQYRLGWLPLGGYVKMLGESEGAIKDPQQQKRAFSHKPLWQRSLIVLAGPLANLVVLPVLVFGGMFLSLDQELSTTVGTVLPGRPAAQAGLQPGDKILSIDGVSTQYFRDLRKLIEHAPGRAISVRVARGKREVTLKITPFAYDRRDILGSNKRRGLIGITAGYRIPEIGISDPKSPAYRAGLRTFDKIIAVNGKPIKRWDQFVALRKKNPAGPHRYTFRRKVKVLNNLMGWQGYMPPQTVTVKPELRKQGEKSYYYDGIESSERYVNAIHPGTPVAGTGIQRGDRMISLAGREIRTASDITTLPQQSNKSYTIVYERDGKRITEQFKLTPTTWVDPFKQRHQRIILGLQLSTPYASGVLIPIENRWRYAFNRAFEETWRFTVLIVRSIGKLFTRELPANSIGGPIMIFQIAQEAVKSGWEIFLQQMILISINLGLINLLPIPVLDGGHLMFFLIEAIIRRPVPAKVRYWALMIGFALILFLMMFAIRNDLQRLLSP